MYRKTIDFLNDWKYESESTLKIFTNLTQETLKTQITEGGRSIGFLSWHITTSPVEMFGRAGLVIDGPQSHAPMPISLNEIISNYQIVSKSIAETVEEKWTDERLLETDDMYGDQWTKGQTLSILIRHQSHHRAQITVLMRQSGLIVPGIYGPAKEEWAAWGMPTMQ